MIPLLSAALPLAGLSAANLPPGPVDYPALVARADLDYTTPADRCEAGQPVGNGRMGSLVWTDPAALHLQINRPDVFAQDCNTTSFPLGSSDYASGCGFVDINVPGSGGEAFTGKDFRQHLSVYDGIMTIHGSGVTVRVIACAGHDVFAVEIDDRRAEAAPVRVDLRMLRFAPGAVARDQNHAMAREHASVLVTGGHSAKSRLAARGQTIFLTQEFREKTHYSASAVAIVFHEPGRSGPLRQ